MGSEWRKDLKRWLMPFTASPTLAHNEVPAAVGLRLFPPESRTSDEARLARTTCQNRRARAPQNL